MKNQTEKDISDNGFCSILARKRLKNFLKAAVSKLLLQLGTTIIGPRGLRKILIWVERCAHSVGTRKIPNTKSLLQLFKYVNIPQNN